MSVDGASSFVWRRAVDGCAKPGCAVAPDLFRYSYPFIFVRCEDCPHAERTTSTGDNI